MGKISELLKGEAKMSDIIKQGDERDMKTAKKMVSDMRKDGKSDDEIKKKMLTMVSKEFLAKVMEESMSEADVQKIIQDLIDTPASDDNDDQGKFVQLLKGLAFSDDPESDKFMKKLMTMVSDKNFGTSD